MSTGHTKEQGKLMTCKTYTSRSIPREQAWWLYYRPDVEQTGLRYRLCLLGTNSLMRDRDKAQDHQGGIVERMNSVGRRRHFIPDTIDIIFRGRMGGLLVYTQTKDPEQLHTSAALNLGYS